MLPGKKYAPEDILKVLRKRFWVVLVPWAIIAAATAGVARKLPDMYRSTALIQVVPPQVSEAIVRSTGNTRFEEKLNATQQSILSRNRLEAIIQEFNLYPGERRTRIMQEVVERMRRDINVRPQKGEVFAVHYVGRNPHTVWKVTEQLARQFIDESVKDGTRRAEGTSSFIESQVDEAKRKLVVVEDKLKDYKIRHSGELPTQQAANMNAIQTINANLNSIAQALSADMASKASTERLIESLEAQGEPVSVLPAAAQGGGTAAQRLAVAKANLANALTIRRLKPEHPDVVLLQSQIRKLQQEADEEALRAPVGVAVAASPTQARLAGLRDEVERLNKQIARNQEQEKKLRAAAAGYQARIDQVPVRETELVELTREYEVLSGVYQNLVKARENTNMSLNLNRQQFGEQFTLIDPARLPERPFSPDRLMINLFGIMGGLAAGVVLVGLLEYRDGTFKADHEVASVLALPVLAVVPLMRSDAERRADFRKRLFLNLGLGSAVTVCVAVLAYSFIFVR